jgi:hypothetical protein
VSTAAASPRYAGLPSPPADGDAPERPPLGDCAEPTGLVR